MAEEQKKFQLDSEYAKYDLNGDGIVTDEEMARAQALHEMEVQDRVANAEQRKGQAQRRMVTVCLIAMLAFTIVVMIPGIIPETRLKLLGDISGLFYIAMAGVVGAYMGMTAYMTRK